MTLPNSLADKPEQFLNRLYNNNQLWIQKFVTENNGTKEDALDVLQEGMTAAWINLKLGKFKGNENDFTAYLRIICKNKWRTELRKKKGLVIQQDLDLSQHVSEGTNLEDLEEAHLMSQRLITSVNRLRDKCREILNLYYYKKKSLKEIAALLKTSEESVKMIKFRCMSQLREFYLSEKENEK